MKRPRLSREACRERKEKKKNRYACMRKTCVRESLGSVARLQLHQKRCQSLRSGYDSRALGQLREKRVPDEDKYGIRHMRELLWICDLESFSAWLLRYSHCDLVLTRQPLGTIVDKCQAFAPEAMKLASHLLTNLLKIPTLDSASHINPRRHPDNASKGDR